MCVGILCTLYVLTCTYKYKCKDLDKNTAINFDSESAEGSVRIVLDSLHWYLRWNIVSSFLNKYRFQVREHGEYLITFFSCFRCHSFDKRCNVDDASPYLSSYPFS